jgi:hypothetical protein
MNSIRNFCPITRRWEDCICCIAEYCKKRVDYYEEARK